MNQPAPLPRYLSVVCGLLILYVCLHPFSGWRDSGVPPLDFLTEPWPKYTIWSDIWENVAGYLPFGFVLAPALKTGRRPWWIFVLVLLICAGLSFSVEFVQNYLPTRVASNLDLATNVLGGAIGGIAGLRWGKIFDDNGLVQHWRSSHVLPGHVGEMGLILVGLWWLSQLEPTTTLFGDGDLRVIFDLPAPMEFSAQRYMTLESAIVAFNTLGLGLLLMRILRHLRIGAVLLVLAVGLGLRSLADYVFIMPADPLHWATTSGLRGLVLGLLLLAAASRLPRWGQHSLASLTLLSQTALVNVAPDNPFIDASVRTVQAGHFLNFYGLTQFSAALWPFLALAYLSALAGLRRY
jgi:VanZ family protein